MDCEYCKEFRVAAKEWLHESTCPTFSTSGQEIGGDELRERVEPVEIGWWADTILATHTRAEMVRKPEVVSVEAYEDGSPKYTIRWVYPGYSFVLERATMNHSSYGLISVYAVQRIEANDEKKRVRRSRKPRAYSSRKVRKGNRAAGSGRDKSE